MITYYASPHVDIAVLEKAKTDNFYCGDANAVIHTEDYTVCAVADGLGSGEFANESAIAAMEAIQRNHHNTVQEMIDSCNELMLSKRGVVITIIKIHHKADKICYTNVGNIGFVMHQPSGETIQPIPSRGYLSGKRRAVMSRTFTYEKDSVIAIYSDGVIGPPVKNRLLNIGSVRDVASQFFSEMNYAEDDITLLIGRLK